MTNNGKSLTANEVRQKFLDFFKSKGHTIVASDSVVPKDDPTVLFTTAGMQQFKPNFLGLDKSLKRAASSQKCLRTDDLDKIGKTAFHHTFFEMLGNFSFADYFKKEAIAWAWEFLTKEIGLPAEKLWVSVYKDDDEAYQIWLNDMKLPAPRIVKLGDKDNFWPANAVQDGPNGPCGPCSEIFFDYGVNKDCPKGEKCDPSCNCGRFTEVWNNVFTQFNRKDGGALDPLPGKNIDTGMGLERLVAVVQGKKSNYDSDLFVPILQAIDKELGKNIPDMERKIVADHIRAIVFAIADGIIPSNKERGSVVKRLINDATNIALNAGAQEPRIHKLVATVIAVMKQPYPELVAKENDIVMHIKNAEEAFILVRQLRVPELQTQLAKTKSSLERGSLYFKYRDTFGLPVSVIATTAEASGISSKQIQEDMVYFHKHMEEQKERSRAGSKMAGDVFADTVLNLNVPKTEFLGYAEYQGKGKVLKLLSDNQEVEQASQGEEIKIILDRTPFYAEAGGQIGDTGTITAKNGKLRVTDTQKKSDIYIHTATVEKGAVKLGDEVETQIDSQRRASIMKNHTGTHLLQSALRKTLGTHVQQQGSLVAEDRLRFDFTHPKGVTQKELQEIEDFVNSKIATNDPVSVEVLPIEEAKKKGALAFFAEKYGQVVRVVTIGDYSKEFCGGTHLKTTGEIEKFKITSEGSVAQGIRRLEAKTGKAAEEFTKEQAKSDQAKQEALKLREAQAQAQKTQWENIKNELKDEIEKIKDKKAPQIVAYTIKKDNVSVETLRNAVDFIKQSLKSAVVLLGSTNGYAIAAVTEDLISRVKANEIIEQIKPLIDGNGGGRPQMAQAGTKDPSKIEGAIKKIHEQLEKALK